MLVRLLSLVDCEKKRQIGIVCVQHLLLAQVESIIGWNGGKEGVQQVVSLFVEKPIVAGEYLLEFRDRFFNFQWVFVIENDRKCEFPKILPSLPMAFRHSPSSSTAAC